MTDASVVTDVKKYELMVIINPEIGEEAVSKRLEAIRKLIKDFPGEIFHEELWGLKDLAYAIKKYERGFYAVVDFSSGPDKLREFDATLRLEPEVIRHFLMVLPSTYVPKDYALLAAEEAKKAEEEKLIPTKKHEPLMAARPALTAQPPAKSEPLATAEPAAPVVAQEAKEAKAAEAEKREPQPKSPKKKDETKQALDNVDAKLQSILENPDLNF